MAAIDINCDLGEGFAAYTFGRDEAMLSLISSANVACGFHAGDPRIMEVTVRAAAERGVGVGAHVSYPDRVGFGRRVLEATPDEVRTDTLYQIAALAGFCQAQGVRLQHVKPHGALYNVALRDAATAAAIAAAIASFDRTLALVAPPGSELARAGREAGLPVAYEAFVDRHYLSDGTLVPRSHPRALITDPGEAAERIVRLVTEGRVTSIDGDELRMEVQTVCIHGDNPQAVAIATATRKALLDRGVAIRPLAAVLPR